MGLLPIDRPFVREIVIGTRFFDTVEARTTVGELPALSLGDRERPETERAVQAPHQPLSISPKINGRAPAPVLKT
jgi:hypothetical protein